MKRNKLYITIGTDKYHAYIAPGPIIEDGGYLSDVVLEATKEIIISPTISPEQRLSCLIAAAISAWTWVAGWPNNVQAWRKFNEDVTELVMRDLEPHGGEAGLKKMARARPTRT